MKKIIIGVLSQGAWKGEMANALMGLCLHSAYLRHQEFLIAGTIHHQSSDGVAGRNDLVRRVQTLPGVTHLLMVDSDMTFPMDALSRLAKADAAVIGCNALMRSPPFLPTGEKRADGKWTLGCAFMLCQMSIFQQIPFPWFDAHYLPGGKRRGEDQDFCDKVNTLSAVCCDEILSQQIGHIGQMTFTLEMQNQLKP